MNRVDVLIVGAGPAGMSAAIAARRHRLEVVVVDDQPQPGGQIWRSVEMTARRDAILGTSYYEGRAVVDAFRASGATYLPKAQVWKIEPGFRVFLSRDRQASVVESRTVLLASGAQERPAPFPGWTLPGVLTVGAAQILLKNAGQIPSEPIWVAGCGPLPLLYAVQLLNAGGRIAGYLDTTPSGQWLASARHLPRALLASREVVKGLGWMKALRKAKIPMIRGVTEIEALGNQRVEALRYRRSDGESLTAKANIVLVHEGVVPSLHIPLSLNCEVAWVSAQECYAPIVDKWGESSRENLFIAGDGAGIGGAKAALLRGELAALRVAEKLGRIEAGAVKAATKTVRRRLERELAIRPFLDALFKPRSQIFSPSDETVVCRCEEVTAGQIRAAGAIGRPGSNQIKAATRAGMGPCQGRQCGYTVIRILSAMQKRPPSEVGFFHVRPPLKPVTLGEVASLNKLSES